MAKKKNAYSPIPVANDRSQHLPAWTPITDTMSMLAPSRGEALPYTDQADSREVQLMYEQSYRNRVAIGIKQDEIAVAQLAQKAIFGGLLVSLDEANQVAEFILGQNPGRLLRGVHLRSVSRAYDAFEQASIDLAKDGWDAIRVVAKSRPNTAPLPAPRLPEPAPPKRSFFGWLLGKN